MKTLLINPPVPGMMDCKEYYVPSSLLYLAAALQNKGEQVQILDFNIYKPWEDASSTLEEFCDPILVERMLEFRPTLVGIGCLFSGHIGSTIHFAEMIKARFPGVFIVIGGIHPTLYAAEILENVPAIDWVVIGEGENTLVQLVELLNQGLDQYGILDGFAYRQRGRVVINPKTTFNNHLDDLPFPAYGLIDPQDYYIDTSHWHNPRNLPINISLPIISSRACPMNCNFCSMYSVMGRRWRSRSAKNVVDEIEFLYDTYGLRHFSFFDDQLTLKKSRIIEISNEIVRRNLYLQIESQNGVMVKSLDKDVLDALVAAGLVRIALAIESGSDYIRNDIMGKKLPRERVYEVAQLTKKYQELFVKAFFIMGMAEDTHETLNDTYRMIQEIDVDRPHVFNLLPFPGTRVFDQAIRDQLFVEALDLNKIWRFEGFYGTGNEQFFIKPYHLSMDELVEWRGKFDDLIAAIMRNKATESQMMGFPQTR